VLTYIAKSIDDFNTGIYKLANLPTIDTSNRAARPLGQGRRTLACSQDHKGKATQITLNKVIYLLNCLVNIFGARELLGSGKIYIKDRNLVVNQKGKGLFCFNKHIIIIKEPKQYAFPIVT
jgi:hypothetical protein